MCSFPHSCLFVSLILVLSSGSLAQAQRLPAVLFGGGTQTCSYEYAIPKGGNCDTYMSGLDDKLKSTRQDLEVVKNQFISHNTQLLEDIRQLKQETSSRKAEVDGVIKDFKDLQDAVFMLKAKINNNNGGGSGSSGSGSGSGAPSDAMLQQLVYSTRQDLTQTMTSLRQDLTSAVSALNTDRQKDAIQQSTLDSAFQDELRQQQQDLTSLLQRLLQLQQRVNSLQPLSPHLNPSPITPSPAFVTTTTAPSSWRIGSGAGVSNGAGPVLSQLQSDVKRLADRLSQLQASYVTDVPSLRHNVTELQELMQHHTLSLSDLGSELDYLQSNKLPDLSKQTTLNYGAISQLSSTMRTDFQPLQSQVQKVASNVTSLVTQINRLGSDILSQVTHLHQDETEMSDLSVQVHLLASKLSALMRDQHLTTSRPSSTPPPTTATFAIPTPRN